MSYKVSRYVGAMGARSEPFIRWEGAEPVKTYRPYYVRYAGHKAGAPMWYKAMVENGFLRIYVRESGYEPGVPRAYDWQLIALYPDTLLPSTRWDVLYKVAVEIVTGERQAVLPPSFDV